MANQKHGAVKWGDSSFDYGSNSSGKDGKDRFLKLKPGSNPIRVLTDAYQYYQHKYKFDGEKGYGHRIPCSAKNGACVVCEQGDKPKRRWYIGVIDRNTNSYKILDVSWSVLGDINTYAQDPDWGDPIQYDFDIVVNPNAPPQHYYKAVAKPKKPLSADDLRHKEQVDIEYLEKKSAPADPKFVEERFLALKEEALNSDNSSNSVDEPVSFKTETMDFPNADSNMINPPF